MSFPPIFQDNFESGDNTFWDSQTDTASQLDFPHYSALSNLDFPTAVPYSGAYCMRTRLTGGTSDAYVSQGNIDIADTINRFFAFNIWISPDFTGTADDTINIFEARSGSAQEITFGLRIVASTNVVNFGIGKIAPTSFTSFSIRRGQWYTVELDATLQTGGSGTIDLYITKAGNIGSNTVAATQVGSLTQIAVTHGRIGVQDHLSTTTGSILIDNFVMEDTRIYASKRRYREVMIMTQSGHAFVGKGELDNVSLFSGAATDNVVAVYDTDEANTNDPGEPITELKNTANNELVDSAVMPVRVSNGAYVTLSGTNPRALVKMKKVVGFSDATIRYIGSLK